MYEKRPAAFVAILICVIAALLFLEVETQSTVDGCSSCESSTLYEGVNLIREDLKDVKNLLKSTQQQNNASSISNIDVQDIQAALASNQ